MLFFDITELAGADVTDAWLYWSTDSNAGDDSGDESNFFAVVGITDTLILDNVDESDFTYTNYDQSGGLSWASVGIDWSDFDWITEFGDYVHADNALTANTFYRWNYREYIRYLIANGETNAGFAFHGHRYTDTGRRTFGWYSHIAAPASLRPVLIVHLGS